jgi:hypothetical protein
VQVQQKKTLEEANALIPVLERIFRAQGELRTEIERRLGELASEIGEVPEDLTTTSADPPRVRRRKNDLAHRIAEYQAGWSELDTMGAVLKDPRLGLVDFYGEVDGELVWLCWRVGEAAITHYHKLREGFSNRRPIDEGAKKKLLN